MIDDVLYFATPIALSMLPVFLIGGLRRANDPRLPPWLLPLLGAVVSAGMICLTPPRFRGFLAPAMVAPILFSWRISVPAYAVCWTLALSWAYRDVLEIRRMQDELHRRYPTVSLRDRVGLSDVDTPDRQEPVPQSEPSEPLVWSRRAGSMIQIHHQTEARFIMAAGTGVTRMPHLLRTLPALEASVGAGVPTPAQPSGEPIVPDAAPPAPGFDGGESRRPMRSSGGTGAAPGPPNSTPPFVTALTPHAAPVPSLHASARSQFTDAERFGLVFSIDRVNGFLPHRVGKLPLAEVSDGLRIERIELIGLLRSDGPVVYLSDQLPDMTGAAGYPTRPLDDFERAAISGFDGTELYGPTEIDEAGRFRAVGAIRATSSCRGCHGGNTGDLLGAFSYRFRTDK